MRRDAVLVGQPEQRPLVVDQRVLDRAAFLGDLGDPQPVGCALGDGFLEESLFADAFVEAFHGHRATAQVWQHERGDHLVIRRHLSLGDAVVGKEHLLGMGDHDRSHVTSRGFRSLRTPNKREWRSLPWFVHSMKASVTTISGLTQCWRSRGKPVATVNGVFGCSAASNFARRSRSSAWSKPVPTLPAYTKSSFW